MRRRHGLPSFQILVASFHSLPTFTHDDMRVTILRTMRPRPTPALVRAAISARRPYEAAAQGTTSPRPTSMRAAAKVPSGCLVAAPAATAAPDLSSLLSE